MKQKTNPNKKNNGLNSGAPEGSDDLIWDW